MIHNTSNFNEDQFNLIKKCAELKDFSEWNNYIIKNKEPIRLEGADFSNMTFTTVNSELINFENAYLREASFQNSTIQYADFSKCKLDKANFTKSKINNSYFDDTDMTRATITEAEFFICRFNCTNLTRTNIQQTKFIGSAFYESCFNNSNLKGAEFICFPNINPFDIKKTKKKIEINLYGTTFQNAIFSDQTYFDTSNISLKTDFRTQTFHLAQYSFGLSQTLQYCNRRHNWEDWYQQNSFSTPIVKFFWWHTDYGYSIKQLIKSFSIIVLLFSIVYFLFPCLIHDLKPHSIIQSIYFSFITMTTLGYGDMYPSHNSIIAQCIVIAQVCYGYILLGSLITLLSNLFFSDSPSQKISKHPPRNDIKRTSVVIKDIEYN